MSRFQNKARGSEASTTLIARLRGLYGKPKFKVGLIILDVVVILSFLILTFVPSSPWVLALDLAFGILLLVELSARIAVAEDRLHCLTRPTTFLDAIIILSLLMPMLTGSFAFLRVVRAVRLFHTLDLVRELRERSSWFSEKEDVIRSATHILIFLLVTSAIVYEAQVDRNPDINTFSDALYFTATTVTTTGFGDITLVGETGRLLSIIIMIAGISLFFKLAQSVIQPGKVWHSCARCGLSRHDPDAVHCKHCGNVVHIPTKGG